MTADRRWSRRRIAAIAAALACAIGLGVEGARYVQLVSDLDTARALLREVVMVAKQAGPAMTAQDVALIASDAARADGGLARAGDTLDRDPLIAIARVVPWLATQIDALATMTSAARGLTSEHDEISRLMQAYVEIRDASTGGDRLGRLARFAAHEQVSIDAALLALQAASAEIAGLPESGLAGPLTAARTDLLSQLDPLLPIAARARVLVRAAPSLFGVDTPKRYLVVALDNAELRPMGGLIAAFATITVSDGQLGDPKFRDIAVVDRPDQKAYVAPPGPLQDHLLGPFTWQVADAGWWPDFARSAGDARRLYAVETGDDHFDGVIAFTPDLVDALIGVLGPIEVPGTGITVGRGQTYVRSLEQAEIKNAGATRKRFLADLASAVFRGVERMSPDRYPALVAALAGAVESRQIQVLPDDLTARAAMTDIGAYTPFRFPDGGDRLSIMGANVAPVSKLHVLLEMAHELDVGLHSDGSADERLTTTYANRFGPDLPPELAPIAGTFLTGNLGTYERRYLPPQAEVLSVRSTGSDRPVTDPETLELESDSLAVGNYLFVRPGVMQLETAYHTASVVQRSDATGEWVYRLQFRKQAGRDHDRLTVRVTVPSGAVLRSWTDGGAASTGSEVVFSTTTAVDRLLEVRFTIP